MSSRIVRYIITIGSILLASGLLLYSSSIVAEEELIGSDEYRISCAVCHGVGGKGNGSLAKYLNVTPSDLTILARNNGGQYPFKRIFRMIDGREFVAGHGERAMPVWGGRFKQEDEERYGPFGSEEVVRARILELVYYIQSIQRN